jgi:ankyrin repeat protein
MMGLFDKLKQRHFDSAIQAIEANDIERFNTAYQKLDDSVKSAWLDHPLENGTPSLLMLALEHRHPDLVKRIITLGANPNTLETPVLSLALKYEVQRLSLLTELLKGGATPKPSETLIQDCFEYAPKDQWLILINRLAQFGINVIETDQNGRSALQNALESDNRELLAFLINSGANLPEPLPENLSDELTVYVKRLVEDRKIREMFLA